MDGEYYSSEYTTHQECAKLCDAIRMTLEGDAKKSLCCTHATKWNYMTDETFGDCTLERATELEGRGDELNFFEETMDSFKGFLYEDEADFDNASHEEGMDHDGNPLEEETVGKGVPEIVEVVEAEVPIEEPVEEYV